MARKVIAEGVTQEELEEIRDAQKVFLPSKAIIRRRKFVPPDDYTTQTVAEEVNARFSPGFGQFRNIADRFQGITPFTITFEWDQNVQSGDQVIDAMSRVFEVRDVRAGDSYQTALQCLADHVSDHA